MPVFPCIACNLNVRERQEAIQCDGCELWQHRTCTGITQSFYRQVVRGEIEIFDRRCRNCTMPQIPVADRDSQHQSFPIAESTRNSLRQNVQPADPVSSFEIDEIPYVNEDELPEETITEPLPTPLETEELPLTVQQLGLETAYVRQDATYKFIKKLLALPYLPSEHIPAVFEELCARAVTPELKLLMNYLKHTWMESSVWPVRSWSVFGLAMRTNNDVEGWHRRLNQRATRGNLQLYVLVELLHKEASLVNIQMRLVSEGKLKRLQKKQKKTNRNTPCCYCIAMGGLHCW